MHHTRTPILIPIRTHTKDRTRRLRLRHTGSGVMGHIMLVTSIQHCSSNSNLHTGTPRRFLRQDLRMGTRVDIQVPLPARPTTYRRQQRSTALPLLITTLQRALLEGNTHALSLDHFQPTRPD